MYGTCFRGTGDERSREEQTSTGGKHFCVTELEGLDLAALDRSGKLDPLLAS